MRRVGVALAVGALLVLWAAPEARAQPCGMAEDCDDGNPCTLDLCFANQCQFSELICDDGIACTTESCNPDSGACDVTPHHELCDDGNACNGAESCDPGFGCLAIAPDCFDANPCTQDICDPAVGCSHPPTVCDDGNACTTDSCDPAQGGCIGTAVVCDDGVDCTVDDCDPDFGCFALGDNSRCDDGNACTGDICLDDGCAYAGISCNDDNVCTMDACDPIEGCVYGLVDCDDGVACTVDACDPVEGCSSTQSDALCDDGTACTIDVCHGTGCQSTAMPRDDCVGGWGKSVLQVKEDRPGKEKLNVTFKKGPALDPASYGDPVDGSTAYTLCLFDQDATLAGELAVDRAGEECDGKPCWKGTKTKWIYKDKETAADGVQLVKLAGGDVNRSSISLKAKNNQAKGQTAMPVGITAALASASAVTVQLHGSDAPAGCFGVTIDEIKKQTDEQFKGLGADDVD